MSETSEIVAVFIVSRGTTFPYRRILWHASKEDAQKICSDPRTSGPSYMLCWSGIDIDDPKYNRFVKDNGMHADVLRDHNITILKSAGN